GGRPADVRGGPPAARADGARGFLRGCTGGTHRGAGDGGTAVRGHRPVALGRRRPARSDRNRPAPPPGPAVAPGRRGRRLRPASRGVRSGRAPTDRSKVRSKARADGPTTQGSSSGAQRMKVVLFCGGLGTRLREHSETIPKPLVPIGHRPIIWHLMRYYAHYGHREFILCLGYRGDLVRDYFLNYQETMTNDFTLRAKDRHVELHSRDLDDWRITFVDTGLHIKIGQRLLRVKHYLKHEEMFLANYADGLSDLPLDKLVDEFKRR